MLVDPSPCSGLCLGPPLEPDLRLRAGNLSPLVERPDPGLVVNRRSVRLASKCRGAHKSSLSRAQDLLCRKSKLVRFSARSAQPSSAPTTISPPAPTLLMQPVPPRPSLDAVSLGSSGGVDASVPRSDFREPLTPAEIRSIKFDCGILYSGQDVRDPLRGGLRVAVDLDFFEWVFPRFLWLETDTSNFYPGILEGSTTVTNVL